MGDETEHQPTPGWASQDGHVQVGSLWAAEEGSPAADRLAIAERIARYGWGYDERDAEMLGDCFTADGTWEGSIMGGDHVGPYEGRDTVVDFLKEFWAVQTDQRRHIFTNVIVDRLGESDATAYAYLMLTASTGGVMTPVTVGPYRLELAKETGVWRISRLVAGFDAPF